MDKTPGIERFSLSERVVLVTGDRDNNSLGLFGQEELGWNDRLFVTLGVRSDQNSSFGKNFMPRVAAAQSTSTVTLTAGGAITDSGTLTGTTLTAKTLDNGGSAITLNTASNDFTTIDLRARNAADNANVAGALTYVDATGFDVAAAQTTSTVTLTGGGAITFANCSRRVNSFWLSSPPPPFICPNPNGAVDPSVRVKRAARLDMPISSSMLAPAPGILAKASFSPGSMVMWYSPVPVGSTNSMVMFCPIPSM